MRGGSRRVAATGMAAAGAAAALVLGFFAVEEPATVFPLTLELLFLAGLTWRFLGRVRDPDLRRWLGVLVLAAIGVRVAVLFGVHFVLFQELFAPDAASYWNRGRLLAEHWRGIAPAPEFELGTQVIYSYLNGLFHYVLGDSTFAIVVVNLFAGVWTVLLSFAIAREVASESVGKVAAVLVAFFPSLVLWSVVNIRDALTTFGVAVTVYFGLRIYRAGRARDFVGVVAGVVFLAGLRDYMGFLVLAGLILGAVTLLRPGRIGISLAAGTVLTLVLVFALEQLGLFQRVVVESPLEQAQQLRRGLQQDFGGGAAGSAFGVEYETGTISGALRFIPVGLAFFLFAPFPWAIGSTLQLFTLPEVLVWYALIPFTAFGLWVAPKHGRGSALVVVAVLAVVVTSYALVEGNIGTAYRHRAQVMPLFFLFTAAGIVHLRDRWREKRRRKAARIREARNRLRHAAKGS